MVNQKELLDLILSKPHYYTLNDFSDIYQMTSAEDFVVLNKLLNAMEDNFLVVRDHKDRYCDPKESGLYKGKISINRKGFGFLDLDEEHSIFIAKSNLNFAMNQDVVIVKTEGSLKESPEGQVIKIVERFQNSFIATYRKRSNFMLLADDERINQKIKVQNEKAFKLVDGLKVRCDIIKYGDPLIVNIGQVIGHENDPGVDVQAVLMGYGIESSFSDEVMKQVKTIEEEISSEEIAKREDLRNQLIITIDGDDAKDLDDAISIEKVASGYKLGVHIADVSHYVTPNSALDLEARKRGTSTYVVDRVVPMLPHYLSNGVCSLHEQVERLTLSCEMTIDEYGDIQDYRLFPSIIKSSNRMTYNEVNKILQGDQELLEKYHHLEEMLKHMEACAAIIRRKRSAYGAIDFERDEAKILVNKRGKVVDIKLRDRGESERIIEDFMVSANECVARHTKWLNIPSQYRVHEIPMLKKIRDFSKMVSILGYRFKGSLEGIRPNQLQHCLLSFKEEEYFPVVSTMMLRCMQKARYDAQSLGHFGLALEDYTHFTSPIRRYPDLIVHRMIRKYCFMQELRPNEIENDELLMEEIAESSSLCERRATDAEREVEDMKKAEFMQNKVNEKFEGVISSVTKFGFYVELANTVEGLVHIQDLKDDYYHFDQTQYLLRGERTNQTYRLGQLVEVRLVEANKEKREISFVLANNKKRNRNKSNTRVRRKRR